MLKESFLKDLIAEDIGRGDLFSRISESKEIRAYIIAKSNGVFAGREYVDTLAEMYNLNLIWEVKDGDSFTKGKKLLFITGDSKMILLTLFYRQHTFKC